MNLLEHFILIDGEDKTASVESIGRKGNFFAVKFKNSWKTYSYKPGKVTWMSNPSAVDCAGCKVFICGRRCKEVTTVYQFVSNGRKFYAISNDEEGARHYSEDEIEIRRSCLTGKSTDVFNYLRHCASVNTLGKNDEEESSNGILYSIYSKVDFIDDTTAASVYLTSKLGRNFKWNGFVVPVYPFGCNASQKRAVELALTNQLSVIQGPPGTGKTQTILNIIANLIIAKKSVLIVSNNNSATGNVHEKLGRSGLGFLVAPLGNRENKEAFIANQPALNPELASWSKAPREKTQAIVALRRTLEGVDALFTMQERLAGCRQELAEVKVEMEHYRKEYAREFTDKGVKTSSSKIRKIIHRIRSFVVKYHDDTQGLLKRIKRVFDKFSLELRLRFLLEINENLTVESLPRVLNLLHWLFYQRRLQELKSEIKDLERRLAVLDADALMKTLADNSMTLLKDTVASRYEGERQKIGSLKELFNGGDSFLENYPVVLSTTFSAKVCFNNDTIFDYVIMDEASQVSVETGLLALTCAKNAVIVGDTMQLPNVVSDEDKIKLKEIRKTTGVPDMYDASEQSFLSSVLATLPKVPQTLLREHYRCHPDIINFCNQKFYGGELLIMTRRGDNENHMLALTTAPGKHSRGHYNQREIDAVKEELLPRLDNDADGIGIIAPYNRQTDQFKAQIPEVESATVHKFQGREKDAIIMSVTDDEISSFADNANLLNVAVSRAKEKFCIVVTGNPNQPDGNIQDLLGYIRYQHGTVLESKLHSIFDYLFSEIDDGSKEFGAVSEFKSENLTYGLIEKIRSENAELSHIKVLCHYPLRYLLRDAAGLSEEEARYACHPSTHIDFLVFNRVTKVPMLAIETDGYSYHNEQTDQFRRDRMKDKILANYGLPLLRLSTVGYGEEQKIIDMLLGRNCMATRNS